MTASVRVAALVLLLVRIDCAAAETKDLRSDPSLSRAYRARVIAIVGSAWYETVQRRPTGLSAGTVRVEFVITPSGRARDIRSIATRRDQRSADLLRDVLRKISFPRIPPALLRELPQRRIDVQLDFTL